MKKIVYLLGVIVLLSSCSATKDGTSSVSATRNEKKLARQETVANAVESRRFIVKLNRIYLNYGGNVQLVPRANYIIVDGDKGIISTAYLGRQYTFRPVAAIDMVGRTTDYELTRNPNKGNYNIRMKVGQGSASFNVFLNITKSGSCSASISSLEISNVRYSGNVVPITSKRKPDVPSRGII